MVKMKVMRWDPFRALTDFDSDDASGAWAPAVDIAEDQDHLVIRADIAGVEKNDIDVRVEDNTLVLRGEKKRDKEFNEDRSYRVERSYGSFVRSFGLPKTVDASRIVASYKNGVLEVRLPKAEETKPRKIEIDAA